jgi:hypothetical protein
MGKVIKSQDMVLEDPEAVQRGFIHRFHQDNHNCKRDKRTSMLVWFRLVKHLGGDIT